MAVRYWSLMSEKKFSLIYLGLHYKINVKIERWLDIILAIVSTGSLGALFVLEKYQFIWSIILALTQILTAARPYFPYHYRMLELEKGLFSLNPIYNEIEKRWFEIQNGMLAEEQINELYYEFQEKWDELDCKILTKDSLPRRKRFINIADEEKNQYFNIMFGGNENE